MNNKNNKYKRLINLTQHWEIEGRHLNLILNKPYKVKEITISANGTKDLCYTQTKNGQLKIQNLKRANPQEIVHIPSYDIAIIEFYEDLPKPYLGKCILMEIDEDLEPMIKELFTRVRSKKKGDLYDAYLGKDYQDPHSFLS